MRLIFHPLLAVFFVFLSVNVAANEQESFLDRYAGQRQIFLQLKDAVDEGDLKTVASRIDELDGYPLKEYLSFLVLQKEIQTHKKPASLLARIDQQSDQKRWHRKLLGAAKNRSVELGRWQDYSKTALKVNAPVHPCDDLLSQIKNGRIVKLRKSVADLWVEVSKHTGNCNKAFDHILENVGDVQTAALWRRTVTLLERGDNDSVKKLLRFFSSRDRALVEAWMKGIKNPAEILQSKVVRGHSVHHQKMATMLLRRWARNDLLNATDFWQNNAQHFGFSKKSIDKTVARYAVLAAKRGMSESSKLLNNAKPNKDVRYWRVRQALINSQWQQCIGFLDALERSERIQPRWQYWRGRCLESQGFQAAANSAYESIAGEFDYYGFLAADRLSKSYVIKTSQPLVDESEMRFFRESKGIARAIEYFLVGLAWEGRREWNRAIKSSSKNRYIAASRVAESLGWHDRALKAISAAGEYRSLTTMYPTPYPTYVDKMVDKFSVAKELIYGVMRRESLFIADIRSSAGAVGLMQLMPATAKQVGKQLGVKAPKWKLIDAELNMQLGSKYLNHLLERFNDNMAISAAAYNAGPTRVKKWLADKPAAMDIWVETIPFDETRAYVKAVLFNSVVYDSILNEDTPVRLADKMPELFAPQASAGGL